MEWILNIVHYVVPFLILLGVLVFVHEFGHFIVARMTGVSVSAFSIGFGKELWSVTDKKGTVWKISAIPLGGYCQFLGDADESSSTSEVDLSKYSEEEKKHLFATQKPLKKLAISIAGPLFNYLFAFVTFFGLFYFVGSYDIPPVVSEVIEDSPAQKAGIMKGDRLVEINGKQINDWSDINKEVSIAIEQVDLKIKRGEEDISVTVPLVGFKTPAIVFNIVLFPLPLSPISPNASPFFNSKETSFKAQNSSYDTCFLILFITYSLKLSNFSEDKLNFIKTCSTFIIVGLSIFYLLTIYLK